jgi:hypothetical protein
MWYQKTFKAQGEAKSGSEYHRTLWAEYPQGMQVYGYVENQLWLYTDGQAR